ncbi:CAP domain-containing protein [Hamadaea tsunoensis]|uniref:CAP domain-containing protein n=1 Tax=Hamadaea tsunoensis TaxID=53368 RepID=UPI00041142E9|nr:CAP domain-containing protein [Hamadaea tsunoensis]
MALALAACLVVTIYALFATFAPKTGPLDEAAAGVPEASASAGSAAPLASGATPAPAGSAVPAVSGSAAASKAPSKAPSTAASKAPAAPDKTTLAENKVIDLINVERGKAGCGKLRNDARLQKAARAYSTRMAKENFFSHTSPDGGTFVQRIEAAGYPHGGASAENIAYGYADAQAVVDGWMNSEGHRKNILNCSYKAVGVGLAYNSKNTPYWTQDFGFI